VTTVLTLLRRDLANLFGGAGRGATLMPVLPVRVTGSSNHVTLVVGHNMFGPET
jgi:hypothetical protein